MRSILDLEPAAGDGQSPWNKRRKEAEKNTDVSNGVASLGARLNELRKAETRPEPKHAGAEERNPKMAHETQRAQAAAASAGSFSQTVIPDVPVSPSARAAKQPAEPRNDYELVLGRGQIASCLFAGTVVVAIFAGGAYFAGKLSAVNCVAASNSIPQATAPLKVPSVLTPQTAPSAAAGSASGATAASGSVPFMVGEAKTTAPENKITASTAAPAALAASVASVKSASATSNAAPAAPATSTTQQTPAAPVASGDVKGPMFANPVRGSLYIQVGAVDRGMATVIAEGLRQHGLASFVAPGPTDKIFRVLVGPYANQDDYKRAKNEIDSIDVGNFARQFEK